MDISFLRTEVAKWLVKFKFKNPLLFLAMQVFLYGYSLFIADAELITELINWFGLDGSNIPLLIVKIIDGSKYVTVALLGIISSSTFLDLPQNHPEKISTVGELENDKTNL